MSTSDPIMESVIGGRNETVHAPLYAEALWHLGERYRPPERGQVFKVFPSARDGHPVVGTADRHEGMKVEAPDPIEVPTEDPAELAEPEPGEATDRAHEIVTTERDSHGDAYENHKQIADMWTAFLQFKLKEDVVIHPHEVALMMTDVKQSRVAAGTVKPDHFYDVAGYGDVGLYSARRDPNVEVDE